MPKEPKPTKEKAYKALKDFAAVLDECGVEFMLDGGTLLGFYRDGDFCPDDHDDIDLTTTENPVVMHDILDKAAAKGFKVYKTWEYERERTAQLSVKRDRVKIDLMFKAEKNGSAWWTVYRGGAVTYKAVKSLLLFRNHLHKTTAGVFLVPGEDPKATESYLEARYGEWRKPVHRDNYSCYSSDLCIKKSYEEI